MSERFAAVAVAIPRRRLFTYRVPPHLEPRLRRGLAVRAPLGPRQVIGHVVEWPARPPADGVDVKPLGAVLDDRPSLDPEILELTRFVSDYYLCSWGEAIETALPPKAPPPSVARMVRRRAGADPGSLPARATALRRVLESLPADGAAVALGRLPERDRRLARDLEARGLVERFERESSEAPSSARDAGSGGPPARVTPTAAQARAIEVLAPALERRRYAPFLLYGATGSGKTEVYLRAAEKVLAAGGSALYLVPEIGLTPLLVRRLARRFPGVLAVLHSALSARERHDSWRRIRRGQARLAVGTRSAVFAPLRDLRLIVVDEEQDGSYKQADQPRYHARDLAVVRARRRDAVIVLGSATPSMESYHHAHTGRYTFIPLGGRIEDRPLPSVRIVDMREEFREIGEVRAVSRALAGALAECASRGEQALVLRNRRGWAAALFCPACGERVACRRCSLALTWHRAERRLRCHVCDFETVRPEACPRCGHDDLRFLGEGTERVEEDLRAMLPGVRVARMDRDTVRRRGAHQALLERFERGDVDVLVGTQMIAKGHDFPRVTLVGVLSADQSLGLPDFRSGERTFQLLTQVAGRAGRGERPGTVIVQAFDPRHPAITEAAAQDYEAFYAREIRYRRALRYPPITAMVRILVTDPRPSRAAEWAEVVAEALRESGSGRLLLAGPGPAPVERLRGLHRQQILVRTAGRRRLVGAVDRALGRALERVPARAVHVDVDPLAVL